MKVIMIPLKQIEQNENSRTVYKTADLADLMHSMKSHGLLEPIGVMALPKGKYDLVYGNRRYTAASRLDWPEIPCVVTEASDENERDILNLTENMKRTNTSPAEDGRMFQTMITRGLTINELAVKLGISKTRIEIALDVFNEIPQEFHQKIKNQGHTKQRQKGTISASMASEILKVKRDYNLNRPETRELLKHAETSDTSLAQLKRIAPHLKGGKTLADAMIRSTEAEHVQLHLFVRSKDKAKLEKKYKKGLPSILVHYLIENFKDATLERYQTGGQAPSQRSHAVRESTKTMKREALDAE